ncbi:MAG: hypothetical protein JW891_04140, partial [Candidatus Lokiarchaeota archaeon]|nr:hypothetical protein [Candidatus Lokiarchaeota archaeon]
MIDQAKNEIRELNQKTLFQKAEIKKKYREELVLDIQKSRDYFEEYANEILNNSLSTTLIEMNQKFLDLKLKLVKELNDSVVNELEKKIKENYDNYITFLIDNIRN